MEHLHRCDVCGSGNIGTRDAKIDLSACRDCGFIFHNPRPEAGDVKKYYSGELQYESWIKEEAGRELLWRRRLAKAQRYAAKGAILDVGAGIGQFLYYARNDFDICGTEVSDSAINIAGQKYGVELIRGNVEDIDFGDRKFDLITVFHVLEHVPHPSRLIEKCRSLLKEDGVIIIAVPNELRSISAILKMPAKHILSRLGLIRGKVYGAYGLRRIDLLGSQDEIHLSYFTVRSLKRLLSEHGFRAMDDTLDPHYASVGPIRIIDNLIYFLFLVISKIFRVNLYDAIWIAAKPDAGD